MKKLSNEILPIGNIYPGGRILRVNVPDREHISGSNNF